MLVPEFGALICIHLPLGKIPKVKRECKWWESWIEFSKEERQSIQVESQVSNPLGGHSFVFLPPIIIISHKSFPKQMPHWFVPLPYGDPLWLLYFWLQLGSSLFIPSFASPPLLGALFNRLGFHPTFEKWMVVQVKLNVHLWVVDLIWWSWLEPQGQDLFICEGKCSIIRVKTYFFVKFMGLWYLFLLSGHLTSYAVAIYKMESK